MTCELCHHEASLPENRWEDGVLICAFRVFCTLLYPKLRAAMANPLGESKPSALRLDFDRHLMLQFRDSLVLAMLDCWSMVYRELDDALGLTGLAGEMLADARMGSRHRCSPAPRPRGRFFIGRIWSGSSTRAALHSDSADGAFFNGAPDDRPRSRAQQR